MKVGPQNRYIDLPATRGGAVKVIASIEDAALSKRILDHLDGRAGQQPLALRPLARALPHAELPGLTE